MNIQLYRAGLWETIATKVPVLNGQIKWTATGVAQEQDTIRISLSTDASVCAEQAFMLTSATLPGDVNGDSVVDLMDAIICLQVVSGLAPDSINPAADVNGDGKIGVAEVIYVLQVAAGLRTQ